MQTPEEFLGEKNTQSPEEFLSSQIKTQTPEEFLSQESDPWKSFMSKGKQIAQEEGFPAGVLLGQAQLESASGKSNFAKTRNNYFGLGAYDSDPQKAFRFDTPEDSIRYYIKLVKGYPGVKEAIASGDKAKVIAAIKAAGYATSPSYVQNVMNTESYKNN